MTSTVPVRDYHPLRSHVPGVFQLDERQLFESYNPTTTYRNGLGCSAFARHYLRNH